MAGIAKLDGERAIEAFTRMQNIVNDIFDRTNAFKQTTAEVFDRTNMPFVANINTIVADMQKNITATKESTETVLSELRRYAEMVQTISEGGDL